MTSQSNELPVYDETNALVGDAGFESSAAEIHGTICGVLASPQAEKTDWLNVVLSGNSSGDENLPDPLSDKLSSLFQGSRDVLKDGDFAFAMLIPNQETDGIAKRTEGVAEWCRGFLLGLSAGGLKEFASLPDMVREALEDMLDIAEVIAEDGEDEQQEKAFVELEEYVRVCVQLVYDECRRDAGSH